MNKNTENPLLAHWHYDNDLWQRFSKMQAKEKKTDNIIFSLVILIFSVPILMFVKGAPFLIALMFTAPFAILFPLVRFKKSQKYFKKNVHNPEIKIYTNHLDINGIKKELISKKYWVLSIKTKVIDGLHILYFEIAWNAHKGRTHDEFRIPIPSNEVAKAEEIVAFYKDKIT